MTLVPSFREYINLRKYIETHEESKHMAEELLVSHPYAVPVKLSYGLYIAITEWARDNNIDDHVFFDYKYHFKNEVDAMTFKLIFG